MNIIIGIVDNWFLIGFITAVVWYLLNWHDIGIDFIGIPRNKYKRMVLMTIAYLTGPAAAIILAIMLFISWLDE